MGRVVAVFDRKPYGLWSASRPMSLELMDEAVLPIADEIFVTCIYMQQRAHKYAT